MRYKRGLRAINDAASTSGDVVDAKDQRWRWPGKAKHIRLAQQHRSDWSTKGGQVKTAMNRFAILYEDRFTRTAR